MSNISISSPWESVNAQIRIAPLIDCAGRCPRRCKRQMSDRDNHTEGKSQPDEEEERPPPTPPQPPQEFQPKQQRTNCVGVSNPFVKRSRCFLPRLGMLGSGRPDAKGFLFSSERLNQFSRWSHSFHYLLPLFLTATIFSFGLNPTAKLFHSSF